MKINHLCYINVITIVSTGLLMSATSSVSAQRGELEEVLVTAQKREQRLLDVPMGISAISGDVLAQKGIKNIQDLSFAVPGMSMREDGPGSYNIFLRGLANTYSASALVSVYLDEAPMTPTGQDQLDLRPIDLARVEVLKGPQGTLYGQGSIAGTVRYITNKPDFSGVHGTLKASLAAVDNGDTQKTAIAVINAPIIDDVFAIRFAGTVERDGGWQDQREAGIKDGNGQDLEHFRLSALWQASDNLSVNGFIQRHRNDIELGLGYEEPDRTVAVAIDPARRLIPKQFDYDLYSLTITYDWGFATLTSASSYTDHSHQYPFSYFGGPDTIYGGVLEGADARYSDITQFTQELRLVSAGESRIEWTVGAIYQDLDLNFFAKYDTLYAGFLTVGQDYVTESSNESYALFADIKYALTERFDVGIGLRYFEDDQMLFDGGLRETDSFSSTDPRVYLSYAISEDSNVYASVAKGFRTGGFNRGELPNYEPESVTNYEIGSKSSLMQGNLLLEVAGYYTEYDDMLRRGLVLVGATLDQLTTNIGKVEVKGLEGAIAWKPIAELTLSASASFIDSEVVSVNATDATNVAGDPTDYVPELSYTLSAHYQFMWFDSFPGFIRADYSYRDEVEYVDRSSFPAENVPQKSDDISLLGARMGIQWKELSFELFGTNLTNENKYLDPYAAWKNANRTKPRMLGVEVSYDF